MKQVTISIQDAHWADFQKYYLIKRPIPMIDDPENPGEKIPRMSVSDWIKQGIVRDIFQVLLEGKQMEAFNELEIAIDIS